MEIKRFKVFIGILSIVLCMTVFSQCSYCATTFLNGGRFVRLNKVLKLDNYILLDDNTLFSPGSINSVSGKISLPEIYNFKTKKMTYLNTRMNEIRNGYILVKLKDGRILILGGYNSKQKITRIAEIYNPKTKTFKQISDTNNNIYYTQTKCILLDDGRLFIVRNDCPEIFDPITEKFTLVGERQTYMFSGQMREKYTINKYSMANAVKLSNGKVLIVGYFADPKYNKNAEIFDPKTNKFENTGQMNKSRFECTVTLLDNGQVLIAGGLEENNRYGTNTAEIYEPNTGKFSYTSSMKQARYNHSAVLLSNGNVLITNGSYGHSEDWKKLKKAEIYNTKRGDFNVAGYTYFNRSFSKSLNFSKNQAIIFPVAEIYKYKY